MSIEADLTPPAVAGPSMKPVAASEPGRRLAEFIAALRFDDLPSHVIRRIEDLLLDWVASALAGKGARPVESIARVMSMMGPASGPCEVLIGAPPTGRA